MEILFRVFGFVALNMLLLVHAQTGFISIDCGSDEEYVDETTKLFYNTDAKFIDSGENKNIPHDFNSQIFEKQLTTVRSFPEGVKNCYTLPAGQGKDRKYLIRAVFMCGNVEEYNDQLPEFKLCLDVEEWETVKFNSSYSILRPEIIHVPKTDEIHVCLVNTDSGTPFISALEVRPVDDSMYNKTQFGSLALFGSENYEIVIRNLSSSNLTGKIERSLSSFTSLQHLNLSGRKLTGSVPSSLLANYYDGNTSPSPSPSLRYNASAYGNITVVCTDSSCSRDPCTDSSCSPDPCTDSSCITDPCTDNSCSKESKKKTSVVVPVVASLASVAFISAALFAAYWHFIRGRRHGKPTGVKPNHQESLEMGLKETQQEVIKPNEKIEAKKKHFRYSEVERITNNFREVIGQGGSGLVYIGHLSNGIKVAVKKLSASLHHASKQFQNEAQLLTTIHHRNLVSLMGYCNEGSNMLLIYEYMANGSLKDHLSGKIGTHKTGFVFSWEQRLQIAIEAAQALDYLHEGCNPPIIHRDVKTANILLNEKMQAKVADFGWSRIIPYENSSHVTTVIVGTSGYFDPEYKRTGQLTKGSDVYSFGIVLLELISGRPALEDGRGILDWFLPIFQTAKIEDIVDPKLQGIFNTHSAWRAVETAMSCIPSSSIERKTMSYVVNELKECLKLQAETSDTSSTIGIIITQPIVIATGPQER